MADKRLIKANTLYEELSTLSMTCTGLRAGKGVLLEFMKQYRESVLRIVDEQPTVEAVEVVHGRWLPMYKVDWIYGKEWLTDYICTECGQLHKKKSNYCPNCGAKMDGDGNG